MSKELAKRRIYQLELEDVHKQYLITKKDNKVGTGQKNLCSDWRIFSYKTSSNNNNNDSGKYALCETQLLLWQ